MVQRSLSDQREEFQRPLNGASGWLPKLLELPVRIGLRTRRDSQGAIEAEIPLNLVLGRPKFLQLSAVPLRLYVPDDDVVRTEIIDPKSGREIALTGLKQGSNHDPVVR